jgi:eukaryotic-like serine/threonine-protein kinase
MPALDPDSWRSISPYLDQALDLPEQERAPWLHSLAEQHPTLASDIEKLLQQHRILAQEGFLELSPTPRIPEPPRAGLAIGPYTLVAPIGEGGMGSVWLAERSDGRFERRVAVKFLHLALASRGAARFRREGFILARLAHPRIAGLLDAAVSGSGQSYLILEHVDGEPIDCYCDRHMLDVESRIRLFLDVLAAVAHAHTHLIVHRDLKPSNVLVRADGEVKLLDFGIAKLLEDDARPETMAKLTREAGGLLTPEYAAPEQLTGGPVTTATDVYALGVLLYVLLAGQHPAGAGPRQSAAGLVKAIVETEPPRMSEAAASASAHRRFRRALEGELDIIVAKALKKEPAQRYASVTALADDLGRYLRNEPISARPDTLRYRAGKFVRRNRIAVALAITALVVAVAGVSSTVAQASRARAQRDFALYQLSRSEAINDLNSFLLSDAAPSGRPFTVRELLDRAQQIVNRQQGGDTSRAELLIAIGRQYQGLDEDARARTVLEEAYTLSRRLSEPSTRALASCALAAILSHSGDLVRAETLLREGMDEIPDEAQFSIVRILCLLRGAEVARQSGQAGVAISRVEDARRVLKQAPLPSELLELHTLMDLAESYRIAGRNREAVAAFEQASARLSALGRGDTQTAGTLLNNWGLSLYLLGRPLEAERLFHRAITISSSGNNEESVSPMLLINNARTLRDLARLKEAAAQAERGYMKAEQTGNSLVAGQALLLRATIYRMLGDLRRATGMLDEMEGRWRRSFPPGHIAFASILVERGLIAQASCDLLHALHSINEGVAIADASVRAGRQGADRLPAMLTSRSEVELLLHRNNDAEADAARAVAILQQSIGPGGFSGHLGRAYLALGRARLAQDKREEAQSAFRSAAEQLDQAVGADHPDSRAARALIASFK